MNTKECKNKEGMRLLFCKTRGQFCKPKNYELVKIGSRTLSIVNPKMAIPSATIEFGYTVSKRMLCK